jgi:PRC-barrel domain
MVATADARRETVSLIGSDKVEGTPVFGADDQKMGSIKRLMIDKKSGQVSYAVLTFGGFLGMGEEFYPMPWHSLKYDTNIGGYRVGVTNKDLMGAPKFNRNTDWDWANAAREREIDDYYQMPI